MSIRLAPRSKATTRSSNGSTRPQSAPRGPKWLQPITAPIGRVLHRKPVAIALYVVFGTLLVVVLAMLGERVLYRDRVLPGVEVTGVDVAGASEQTALERTQAFATELESTPLRAVAADTELSVDPSVLALTVDAPGTVRQARLTGREGNPISQAWDFVRRHTVGDTVELHTSFDPARVIGVVDGWNAQVGEGLQDGALVFNGASVEVVEPAAGTGIITDDAIDMIEAQLRSADRSVIELPMGTVEPPIDTDAVNAAAERARRILSAPFTVTVVDPPATITIAPEQLGAAMRSQANGRELDLLIDPAPLRTQLASQLETVETAPRDASFAVNGASVSVVPSVPGRALDLDAIAAEILLEHREIAASVVEKEPERSTEWAQSLNITQQVASYTTNYPAGQERVKNIQRAAQVVDNTIVPPGGTFSLNEVLGPRTAENGYVRAPVYSTDDGFFDDFGGGVSQFSTTMWNATFFAGYKDIAHTPHSIWISRYPKGREATLNYGSIDNKWQNDSNCGVLIRSYAGATSTTVTYYSCKDRTVRSVDPVVLEEYPIETEYVDDPSLPEGTEKQIEAGYTGYRVEYFRYVTKDGQDEVKQRWTWKYDMRPRKVARGTGAPTTTTAPPAPPAPPTTAPTSAVPASEPG